MNPNQARIMASNVSHLLITGVPGVGKTTLIRKLCDFIARTELIGFYTEEIREVGIRKGFAWATFDGRRGILAHVDFESDRRVGKYGVDLAGFDGMLDSLNYSDTPRHLVVIDEIGKMECMSAKFRRIVTKLLDSDQKVLATVALKGGGFADECKHRPDIELLTLTPGNRDTLLVNLHERLRQS